MTPERVRYRERQPLRAADLTAEQAYLLAMRRRHLLAHHSWGVVVGLRLEREPEQGDLEGLRITAGMAVDGYGRELIVPQDVLVPEGVLDDLVGKEPSIDVWLLYARVPETTSQPDRGGKPRRWREEAHVRLTPGIHDAVDPRQPPGVPLTARDFGPYRPPPDDPRYAWPVYLGRICRDDNSNWIVHQPVIRPSVALHGERITAPSGRAGLHVGGELASDNRRFAVSVAGADGDLVDRLVIDRAGLIAVAGDTTQSDGNLTLGAAESDPAHAIYFTPLVEAPTAAAPWQIYRTAVAEERATTNRLHLEIAHPGEKGDPTRSQLAIGHWQDGDSSRFVPCLTVRADCTVVIAGTLKVDGQLIRAPIQPDLKNPAFRAKLIESSTEGMLASAISSDPNLKGRLEVEIKAENTWNVSPQASFPYEATVANVSQSMVESITVYEHLYAAQTGREPQLVRSRILQSGFSLGSSSRKDISTELVGHEVLGSRVTGQIVIIVTAAGSGPVGNEVVVRAERLIEVTAALLAL